MKSISIVLLLLFCSSISALERSLEEEKREWKNSERLLEEPKIENSAFDNQSLVKIKNGSRLDFYKHVKAPLTDTSLINDETNRFNRTHGKYRFKKFLKHFKGPFELVEVDNGKAEILKLKITDPKNKYIAKKVYYRLENLFSEKESSDAYVENGDVFVDIDITDVPVGEFKAYFRILATKTNHGLGKKIGHLKRDKKEQIYSFLHYGKFIRIESPKVYTFFTFENAPNAPWVKISTDGTYSEAGIIISYTYNIYSSEGALADSISSEESVLFYSFKSPGVYELEVIAFDDKQNQGISEKQTVEIVNSAPTLVYNVIPRDGLPGHFSVDFSGTYDEDGQEVILYRYILYQGELSEKNWAVDIFSEEPKIHFVTPASGVEYSQLILAYDESFNVTRDLNTFQYSGGIAPKYQGHYISTDENFLTIRYIGAEFEDPDGTIVSYHYQAIHEDGTIVLPWENETVQHNGLELVKPGKWTF